MQGERNDNENVAMISDLFAFLVFAAYDTFVVFSEFD